MSAMPLVMDSSSLINLHNGGLLELTFQLPFIFTTTDLIRNETRLNWENLTNFGMHVNSFSGQQVRNIYQLKEQAGKGLTAQDVSVFYLARENQWVLCCDDGALRKYATANHVPVHGSIWMLNQLIDGGLVTSIEAATRLRIMRLKGARFLDELYIRTISKWTKK